MLQDSEVMAMVPVKDLAEAEKFYSETLGLKPANKHDFGITYICGGAKMFVYPTPTAGSAKSTVATWEVTDLKAVVKELDGKVEFEHYDYDGAEYDGPIHILGGMSSAWFRDPTGNVLGLNQAS